MRKTLYTFGILVVLTACGVDGEPVQPTANVGVSVGTSGVHTAASVGVRKGPLAISLGL